MKFRRSDEALPLEIRLKLNNDSDGTTSTEFFDAPDEGTVWQDIIALRLHYHHEIAVPFHIE